MGQCSRGPPTNAKIPHLRVDKDKSHGSRIQGSENRISWEPPVPVHSFLVKNLTNFVPSNLKLHNQGFEDKLEIIAKFGMHFHP